MATKSDSSADADVMDPLSDATRRGRNALLISNLFLFSVVQIGAVPTEVSFGAASVKVDASAVLVLAWVSTVYFFTNFVMTIGAERQVWEVKLDELREQRAERRMEDVQLRLAQRRDPRDQRHHQLSPGWEAEYIAAQNAATQIDWNLHRRAYHTRMLMDGYLPIVIALVNMIAAIVRQAAS